MANRVTDSDVQDLLSIPTAVVASNITTAHAVVERYIVPDAATDGSDDDILVQVELYLSAHFYCITNPQMSSKSIAGVSGSFLVQGGKGLEQTTFGQQALALDPTGNLKAIAQPTPGKFLFEAVETNTDETPLC